MTMSHTMFPPNLSGWEELMRILLANARTKPQTPPPGTTQELEPHPEPWKIVSKLNYLACLQVALAKLPEGKAKASLQASINSDVDDTPPCGNNIPPWRHPHIQENYEIIAMLVSLASSYNAGELQNVILGFAARGLKNTLNLSQPQTGSIQANS